MKNMKLSVFIMFALISVLLFFGLSKWMHSLLINEYVVECFINEANVNLPINTTYSCKNMCGPYNKCSITGGRCLSDIDCYGCKPSTSEVSDTFLEINKVQGDDDAGKYAFIAPNYSELTTDVGTRAKLLAPSDKFSPPPEYNTGVNMWKASFDKDDALYNNMYNPPKLTNMPTYPTRYSLSGQFSENGPLASNAYLE